MDVAVFSCQTYDRQFLDVANRDGTHSLTYFDLPLTPQTSGLAHGFDAVCVFINDDLRADTLRVIAAGGTRYIVLRSAGYNHVDLPVANGLGMTVVRVPAYSPYAIAEHAVALILALNRKIYRAYNRVRDDDFRLDGLLGFDLRETTVGIVGTGKIGECVARIMLGFGCQVIAYDPFPSTPCLSLGVRYVDLPELCRTARIISLHCPLTPENHHLIDAERIQTFQPGTMLINTSRGGLINTHDAIAGLKSGQIGYLGIDVYEQESELFFKDYSDAIIQDDTFQLLQSFPNVLITAHQAFFTHEALTNIAETTIANLTQLATNQPCPNEIRA
jgi:D-lactate dehydrogenase